VTVRIINADVMDGLAQLADESVHCVVTSPPYWGLRDYGAEGQIGLEPTLAEHIDKLVQVFREVRRVLRKDGTLWLNYGDGYANNASTSKLARSEQGNGSGAFQIPPEKHHQVRRAKPNRLTQMKQDGFKHKDLLMMPERLALALQADGWWVRARIIWAKCLSGGAVVYARTQKGEMPMTVKDLVRLDPKTVQLWDGVRWNQCLAWRKVNGDPDRRAKSLKARQARYRGRTDVAIEGDIEIELRSGERIGCTREHKWPTQRGLVAAEELRVGDVISAARLPEPSNVRRPEALDDELVGWFVGLYIAEGSRSDDTIQIAGHVNETARFEKLCRLAEAFDGTCAVHVTGGNTATINLNGPILNALVDTYVSGRTARDKRLSVKCWMRSNVFLKALLEGYLSGDGSDANGRWKLGFCDNDGLASDLRVLSARIGASLRLRRHQHTFHGREYPGWLGSLYFDPSRRRQPDTEIVAIRQSRARYFYDIVLEDEPHLFALGSGVLTHNSNPMPESVTDRPTKSHEHIWLLSKAPRYYYDAEAIREESDATPESQKRYAYGRYDAGGVKRANRTGRPDHLTEGNGFLGGSSRNARDVWTIATEPFPDAHFATFPTELAERCIKAGTSEKGCCAECGAPWVRETKSEFIPQQDVSREKGARGHAGQKPMDASNSWDGFPRGTTKRVTTGWRPSCTCNADVVPCTVLDPFFGSGTTGLVADRLQRHAIGIELNPEYAAMAEKRIAREAGLFAEIRAESVTPAAVAAE